MKPLHPKLWMKKYGAVCDCVVRYGYATKIMVTNSKLFTLCLYGLVLVVDRWWCWLSAVLTALDIIVAMVIFALGYFRLYVRSSILHICLPLASIYNTESVLRGWSLLCEIVMSYYVACNIVQICRECCNSHTLWGFFFVNFTITIYHNHMDGQTTCMLKLLSFTCQVSKGMVLIYLFRPAKPTKL